MSTPRFRRLSLPSALQRALEVSRHHGFKAIDVVKQAGEDGYRVLLPEAGESSKDGIKYVAEVKAIDL